MAAVEIDLCYLAMGGGLVLDNLVHLLLYLLVEIHTCMCSFK
jgi:hypothetical protein